MKVVQFNSWAMKHLELFFHENLMATDEVMKNYFARFIGHEMMFMVFSSDFHGIFTNLSFILKADTGLENIKEIRGAMLDQVLRKDL